MYVSPCCDIILASTGVMPFDSPAESAEKRVSYGSAIGGEVRSFVLQNGSVNMGTGLPSDKRSVEYTLSQYEQRAV